MRPAPPPVASSSLRRGRQCPPPEPPPPRPTADRLFQGRDAGRAVNCAAAAVRGCRQSVLGDVHRPGKNVLRVYKPRNLNRKPAGSSRAHADRPMRSQGPARGTACPTPARPRRRSLHRTAPRGPAARGPSAGRRPLSPATAASDGRLSSRLGPPLKVLPVTGEVSACLWGSKDAAFSPFWHRARA